MTRISKGLVVAVAMCTASSAFAFDPLGIYFGGAIGESTIRSNESVYGNALDLSEHHTAWKLVAGMRPISPIGAEFEYIDFGHTSAAYSASVLGSTAGVAADAHPRAEALFAVFYLPIPLPLLDVYGKAGMARLQSDVNASFNCTGPLCTVVAPFSSSYSDNRFAYGAGVQTKFGGLALRAEYERISANLGDPDLFSLGVTWTF